jgi:glycosyltransferase involved in cell wall biosynthesis
MERILAREQATLVCLLHDLIPIEFPEYQRPGEADKHLRRIRTVARLASAVVTNSDATRRSFLPYLHAEERDIPVRSAHLGVDPAPANAAPPIERYWDDGRAYFICVGTIEARKNHLLLLNIWRRMAEEQGGEVVPRLILVGRRGWENEQVVDMLERCPSLSNCVSELNGLPDSTMRELIRGARALLMPSFAEGFGMPITEAIGLGVPVICSDIAAFREAGETVPEYLDPLDGPAWIEAVTDYCAADGSRRDAQLKRMAGWQATRWRDHVRIVLEEAEQVAA